MAGIQLVNVSKRWGNVTGVRNFDLTIEDREFLVLLGPSGCGKSTTMRMIAGLEDVSEGEIRIGDRVVNKLEPKDRDISMVFQSYGLYPNMTVYENIRFPLKVRKVPKEEQHDRVMAAAEMVGLTDLLERRPAALSGGQRQRVALGRAIVREPTVFLMDEPLSNLDAKLRVSTRAQIKNLQYRLKTTTIYVTHDQIEAMTLADRVVVMNRGVIQQIATPTEIYDNPANTFVAGFIGSPAMNLVEGDISDGVFTTENMRLEGLPHTASGRVILGFRAEDATVTEGEGAITGSIYALELLGEASMAAVHVGGELVNIKAGKAFRADIGDKLTADIRPRLCHLFDRETGERISERT
ncbi:ABC transporter ATP-binding protein [Pararhizobium mangrovi]|uniref:sn-glycerol-3-phosphate ABC transporter ATP-binding protein UgpC n=1 Tax=Pararhizobium mangrovi TaxID=2590452 RepID=A0A506U7A5_9HYPH|nr:sn-glycerol-3-phosphate ABC transporter ATP-binding protein UgpC [Pararhizobium mangrovi]TPW28981.1 sn-glycerol-3-phosphate ABC transporter ATP-binding protein UgpC [Pararhizobium mangrovi]